MCFSCRLHQRQHLQQQQQQQQQQRRALTTSSSTAPPKPPPSGIAPLPSRRLISVAGPDAAKFLQGIVTSNVAGRGDGCYAAFLTATGRVLHDVFIYPAKLSGYGAEDGSSPAFLIEGDAAQIDSLAKYIKRYKLRAKVKVRTLDPGEVTVWQAWDNAEPSLMVPTSNETSLLLKDPRTPDMGYRILQLGDGAPRADLDETTEDAYTVRRYLRGVAEGQDELIKEHSLPQESNMDFMGGIDYHKGCYVGQELTIRTKHRGVVRKRILPCIIYDREHAPPSALQYEPAGAASPSSPVGSISADAIPQETSIGRFEKRGRSAGKWLRGVGNIGLGLCRLEIMTGVTHPGETAATGFSPDHEFILEWGEEDARSGVKVKAFVPDWVQQGLDAATR